MVKLRRSSFWQDETPWIYGLGFFVLLIVVGLVVSYRGWFVVMAQEQERQQIYADVSCGLLPVVDAPLGACSWVKATLLDVIPSDSRYFHGISMRLRVPDVSGNVPVEVFSDTKGLGRDILDDFYSGRRSLTVQVRDGEVIRVLSHERPLSNDAYVSPVSDSISPNLGYGIMLTISGIVGFAFIGFRWLFAFFRFSLG